MGHILVLGTLATTAVIALSADVSMNFLIRPMIKSNPDVGDIERRRLLRQRALHNAWSIASQRIILEPIFVYLEMELNLINLKLSDKTFFYVTSSFPSTSYDLRGFYNRLLEASTFPQSLVFDFLIFKGSEVCYYSWTIRLQSFLNVRITLKQANFDLKHCVKVHQREIIVQNFCPVRVSS